jgi:hypothetical protein
VVHEEGRARRPCYRSYRLPRLRLGAYFPLRVEFPSLLRFHCEPFALHPVRRPVVTPGPSTDTMATSVNQKATRRSFPRLMRSGLCCGEQERADPGPPFVREVV